MFFFESKEAVDHGHAACLVFHLPRRAECAPGIDLKAGASCVICKYPYFKLSDRSAIVAYQDHLVLFPITFRAMYEAALSNPMNEDILDGTNLTPYKWRPQSTEISIIPLELVEEPVMTSKQGTPINNSCAECRRAKVK